MKIISNINKSYKVERDVETKYLSDGSGKANLVEISVICTVGNKGRIKDSTIIKMEKVDEIENEIERLTKKCLESFDMSTKSKENEANETVQKTTETDNNTVPNNESEELTKYINNNTISKNEENENKEPEEEKLEENELDFWSNKSMRILGDEIERLKNNKKNLDIKDNQQLEQYISKFSNGNISKATEIIPRNITKFNDYLENIVSSAA
jgi:hypothetical protein